jgi:hypothetical protein
VDVDARRLGRFLFALCLVALAILVVFFSVVGAHHNDQINRLRHDGVPVTVTVSTCQGLLGGSGSNAAGYSCRGAFTVSGHRYNEAIPGNSFYAPGTTLRSVTVPGDPALLSPARSVAAEHASWKVFILPGVLLVVLLLLLGVLLARRRRARAVD